MLCPQQQKSSPSLRHQVRHGYLQVLTVVVVCYLFSLFHVYLTVYIMKNIIYALHLKNWTFSISLCIYSKLTYSCCW